MNEMTKFQWIIPPVVTPLNDDGSMNYDDLENLVEHMVASGVGGLFVLGSTGQVAYMSDDERVAAVRHISRTVDGRVPVIAGAIELSAARVSENAKKLTEAGADAIVATAPVYTINYDEEIADHFRLIHEQIDVPLLAYDIPVRVHKKLSPALLLQLGLEGVISGVKDSSGDDVSFRKLVKINRENGSPLSVLTGHEVVVDAMAMIGADGAVPGLANVDVQGYVRLWEAALAGDIFKARAEQERLNKLFEIVFCAQGRSGDAAGVGAFKVTMQSLGLLGSAKMAAPIKPFESSEIKSIEKIVSDAALVQAN